MPQLLFLLSTIQNRNPRTFSKKPLFAHFNHFGLFAQRSVSTTFGVPFMCLGNRVCGLFIQVKLLQWPIIEMGMKDPSSYIEPDTYQV